MGLTGWLLRHTPPRPLVAAMPGGTAVRLAVERVLRARGWREAVSPAEANLLVVAGTPREDLRPYLEAVWRQIPEPRTRASAESARDAPFAVDAAVAALRTIIRMPAGHGPEPGDVEMADRGADRDGLTLDRVHLPLGPVLPDWPAGLVVHNTVQGDVIQQARVEFVGRGDPHALPFWTDAPHRVAARRLDSCSRLLSVAGWADAATTARRFRDEMLPGDRSAETAGSLSAWARRVRRSRVLRWSLAGVGVTPDVPSTPPGLRGDTLTRLHRWLAEAERALTERYPADPSTLSDVDARVRETRWALDALPDLLAGTEIAAARLLVAGLDPDLDTVAAPEVAHD